MTAIRKSDAQLDAEAAARQAREPDRHLLCTNPTCTNWSLDHLIPLHRKHYASDLWIDRLTTETPPVSTDPNTGQHWADPMSRLGPTLSYPLDSFVRYNIHCDQPEPCGHDHSADEIHEYPPAIFPWSKAYFAMRAACRRTHTRGHHENEKWHGSLCGALVGRVIRMEVHYDRAAYELDLSPSRAERPFRAALKAIEERMLALAADRPTYSGPLVPEAAPPHHAPSQEHIAECPHPECVARRAAA